MNLQDTQERQLLHLVRGISLKPLYIRKLAGFFKCLFYFRLKIQYIFYIYGWFPQLHFCQYPALPEKPSWLYEMLFLFLTEKTAAFFVSRCFFQTIFSAWKKRFLLTYNRHLNWLFGMFFSFPVQNLFPFPAFQPTFPVIFTQDIFLFPDISTGFFSGLFCFWLAF